MAPRRGRHIQLYRSASRWRWRWVDATLGRAVRLVQQWRFRVVGGNNEKMAPSQAYTRKSSAVRAARSLYPTLTIYDDHGRVV